MPFAASPASKTPGANLKRGSFTSEPVIPGGSGCAFSGANGFACCCLVAVSGALAASGDGDGDGVWAIVLATKDEDKTSAASSKRKAISLTRYIVSPLRVFHPAWFA